MDNQINQFTPDNYSLKNTAASSDAIFSSDLMTDDHECFEYQEELDSIADEMARRNNNVGFVIGGIIRNGFDNLVIPSFKSAYHFVQDMYNWGNGLFSSRSEETLFDQKESAKFNNDLNDIKESNTHEQTEDLDALLRNYIAFNTHYPVHLTANQRACMSLDMGADFYYNETIKIYHNETVFFNKITDINVIKLKDWYIQDAKDRLEQSLKHYQHFAQIDYEFVSDLNNANVKTILYDEAAAEGRNFWGAAHLPASIHQPRDWKAHFELKASLQVFDDSVTINHVFEHELGHLILGLHHPFDAFENTYDLTPDQKNTIKKIGEILDHPEWTVMTYTRKGKVVEFFDNRERPKSLLTHKGIGFCESIAAYAKYGSPLKNKGKNVYIPLNEGSYLSSVIPATGTQSLHLDAFNMSSAVKFVLESSFKPTQFKNGQFFIPPDISTLRVTTSMWPDKIHLGPNSNYVDISGGNGKTLIIQPDMGSTFVTGFRPHLDKIIFQGSNFSYEKINVTCYNSFTTLTFGEKGSLDLKPQTIGCFSKNELQLNFESEIKDGVHYLLNLYKKNSEENLSDNDTNQNNNSNTNQNSEFKNNEDGSLQAPFLLGLTVAFIGYKARSKFNRQSKKNEKIDENLSSGAGAAGPQWRVDRQKNQFVRI